MEEPGVVVKVQGDRAEVEIVPSDACAHCGAAGICHWTGKRAKLVIARNQAGARPGDRVAVETTEKGRSGSTLVVFGLPAVLMVAGVVAGSLLWSDTGAAVLAGAGLLVGLAVVKLLDVRAGRHGRSLPVVARVLDVEVKGGSGESMGCGDTGRAGDDELR